MVGGQIDCLYCRPGFELVGGVCLNLVEERETRMEWVIFWLQMAVLGVVVLYSVYYVVGLFWYKYEYENEFKNYCFMAFQEIQ